MVKRRICFRADGDSQTGLGHVFRSLSLADMLKGEFECHFYIRNPMSSLIDQIKNVCSKVSSLSTELNLIEEAEVFAKAIKRNDIVVLDGYLFGEEYQKTIKLNGNPLVCIDDIIDYRFLADVIINHAGGVSSQDYLAKKGTVFLLGPKYAMVRREFIRLKHDRTTKHKRIFICMGGADPKNDTLKIIKSIIKKDQHLDLQIVIGPAYIYKEQLLSFLEKQTFIYRIYSNLSPESMASLMNQCHIAITPPSTISYEYLNVGGELYIYQTAENQERIYNYLLKNQLAFKFIDFPVSSSSIKLSQTKQNMIFDGNVASRFIKVFKSIS